MSTGFGVVIVDSNTWGEDVEHQPSHKYFGQRFQRTCASDFAPASFVPWYSFRQVFSGLPFL